MDWTILLLVAGMLLMTMCSAFFSGSETALFTLEHAERAELRRARPARAAVVDRLCADPRGLLTTLLLGNVVVNTLYVSMGGALAVHAAEAAEGSAWMVGGVIGIVQVVWLVTLGELLPKVAASSIRARLAPAVSPAVAVLVAVTRPVRRALASAVIAPVARLTGAGAAGRLTSGDLAEAIAVGEERGTISADEESMLRRLLAHRRLRVRDIMTPRTEVAWVGADAGRAAVVAAARRGRVRRLVVAEGDLDGIVGVLDVRAFLGGDGGLRECCVPPLFVPEVASLPQLEEALERAGRDLAIVVDEFGGTAGIVAIEDSLEQLVGDIVAAGEATPREPALAADGCLVFDGRTTVAECAQVLEAEFPPTHASTIAGLVSEALGRLPRAGDVARFGGHDWRVLSVRQGRAAAVAVRRVCADDADAHQGGGGRTA